MNEEIVKYLIQLNIGFVSLIYNMKIWRSSMHATVEFILMCRVSNKEQELHILREHMSSLPLTEQNIVFPCQYRVPLSYSPSFERAAILNS